MAQGSRPTQCNKPEFSLRVGFHYFTFPLPHKPKLNWSLLQPLQELGHCCFILISSEVRSSKKNTNKNKRISEFTEKCSKLVLMFGKVFQTWFRNSRPSTSNSWLSVDPRPSLPHTPHARTLATYASITPRCCAIHHWGSDGWNTELFTHFTNWGHSSCFGL